MFASELSRYHGTKNKKRVNVHKNDGHFPIRYAFKYNFLNT